MSFKQFVLLVFSGFILICIVISWPWYNYIPRWKYNGPMNVSYEQYKADKDYFIQFYLDNIEYNRLHCIYDEARVRYTTYRDSILKYPELIYIGIPYEFNDYGRYHNLYENNQDTSLSSAYENFEVIVDTMLYSKDKKFSFILYAVKFLGGLHKSYDCRTMIGCREVENGKLRFYPLDKYVVWNVPLYRIFMADLRNFWLNKAQDSGPGEVSSWKGGYKTIGANLNDPDFFEKASYFQKFDDTTYFFQLRPFEEYDSINSKITYKKWKFYYRD